MLGIVSSGITALGSTSQKSDILSRKSAETG